MAREILELLADAHPAPASLARYPRMFVQRLLQLRLIQYASDPDSFTITGLGRASVYASGLAAEDVR